MTKEDFSKYVDQTLTKLKLYAELHARKNFPEELFFYWSDTSKIIIAKRLDIIDEITSKMYLSENAIHAYIDLKIFEETDSGKLKIRGYFSLENPRFFDPAGDMSLAPCVYHIDEELISPEVDISSEEFRQLLINRGLLYPIHQEAFMHWVPPCYAQWQEDEIKNRNDEIHDRTYEILYRINCQDTAFMGKYLEQNLQKPNLRQLDILVEFMRGHGFPSEQGLFTLLVKICHKLLQSQLVFEHWRAMWIIRQYSKTSFHQGGGSEEGNQPFFELTSKILDKKYYCLADNENAEHNYQSCIYFILMASEWFKDEKEEFMVIWDKLQPFTEQQRVYYYLFQDWTDSYEELSADK